MDERVAGDSMLICPRCGQRRMVQDPALLALPHHPAGAVEEWCEWSPPTFDDCPLGQRTDR